MLKTKIIQTFIFAISSRKYCNKNIHLQTQATKKEHFTYSYIY